MIQLNLANRRAGARLRREYPCLFFLPALILGQLLGYWFDYYALFVLGLLGVLLIRRLGKKLIFLAVVGGGVLSMALALPQNLKFGKGRQVVLRARVDRPPRYGRPGEVEISLNILSVKDEGEERAGLAGQRILCRAVDLPWRNASQAAEGAEMVITAEMQYLDRPLNPMSYPATLMRHGYAAACRILYAGRVEIRRAPLTVRLRDRLVQKVSEIFGNNQKTGMLLSMALGFRDWLSDRTEAAFKATGLAHLLVASGYQVTLVYYMTAAVLRLVLLRIGWLAVRLPVALIVDLFSLAVSLIFVALIGVEGSSLRAALAVLSVIIGRSWERGGGMFNTILVSLLVLALIWPGCYFEPGVQLTYAALAGICLGLSGGGRFRRYLEACLNASVFTSLAVLGWFGQFSLIGFMLNPILAPLAAGISCQGGFLGLAAHLSGLDPAGWILGLVVGFLDWFRRLVIFLAGLKWAALQLEGAGKVIGMTVLGGVCSYQVWRRYINYLLERNLFRG